MSDIITLNKVSWNPNPSVPFYLWRYTRNAGISVRPCAPSSTSWSRSSRRSHRGSGNNRRACRSRGAPGTRIENRIGGPAANLYLYFASQIYAGLDGIAKKIDPDPPDATLHKPKAGHLPATLAEALSHLKQDQVLRDGLGSAFVDYYCRIKEAEITRYNLEVSDWEHREYFDLF